MRPRLIALALATGPGLLALASDAHAGCGGCGGGSYAVSGPGHVASTQGTFTTGAVYAPPAMAPQAAPVPYAQPAMTYVPQPAAYPAANRGGMVARVPVVGRFARRTR